MGAVLGRAGAELLPGSHQPALGALALLSLPCQFLASPSSPIALSKAAMASLGFWSRLHPFFLFSIYLHRGLNLPFSLYGQVPWSGAPRLASVPVNLSVFDPTENPRERQHTSPTSCSPPL